MLKRENVWPDERVCLMGALGVAAFIVYGSLVPFDLRMPDARDPLSWLGQLRFTPWADGWPRDLLVNIGVGMPLGFFLAGTLGSTWRRRHAAAAAAVLVVACTSAALGTVVELLQVLSPSRKSAWNDVLAQCVGAVGGALVWAICGSAVIRWLRQLATERRSVVFAAHLLELYLPLYLIVQLTSLDLIPRPVELEGNIRDRAINLVTQSDTVEIILLRDLVGNVLLSIPIGSLALLGWVRHGTRRPVWRALLFGVAFVMLIVTGKSLWGDVGVEQSLAGALGVAIGAITAAAWLDAGSSQFTGRSRRIHRRLLVAAGVWTLVLFAQSWDFYDRHFTPATRDDRLERIASAPFGSYVTYAENPTEAVHESVLKFVLAFPLGLLLQLAWGGTTTARMRRVRCVATFTLSAGVLGSIELCEMLLSLRVPDLTGALIGAVGAALGIAAGVALTAQPLGEGIFGCESDNRSVSS